MNRIQVKAYLERIDAVFEKPDYENLCRLQRCHLFSVPYENLDILKNI